MVDYKVEIKDVPALKLAALPHKGSYLEIGKEFKLLGDWLASRNLITPETRIIGVYHDDPKSVPVDDLRSHAGIVVDDDFVIEPPLEQVDISGGAYAVLMHTGPYSEMLPAYQWFYGQWLDKSGRETADGPPFEEYMNSSQDTPPEELLTAIYVPLR
jgi:AraC family transcriptional regulator